MNDYYSGDGCSVRRNSSIDILRLLCMVMVVTLHYINYGKASLLIGLPITLPRVIGTIIQSISIVAVNTYILITGYYTVRSRFKMGKLIELVAQVLFYSIGIACLIVGLGIVDIGTIDIYLCSRLFLPISNVSYWFITAYITLYIMTPIINKSIIAMSKESLRLIIVALLILFCVIKSISPILLIGDRYGYDFGWFIVVYLVGAYWRLHGFGLCDNLIKSTLAYVISVSIIATEIIIVAHLNLTSGGFKYLIDVPQHYNYILCLTGAIGLFGVFINIKYGDWANVFCRISPYILGIYLFHEHVMIRELWKTKMPDFDNADPKKSLIIWISSVVIIVAIGLIVDAFRRKIIFALIAKIPIVNKAIDYIRGIDDRLF